jgi:hypothetical protein
MHRTRIIGGAIIIATGLVWAAQGGGLIKSRSQMTDDPLWIVLGFVAVVVGVGLMAVGLRQSR